MRKFLTILGILAICLVASNALAQNLYFSAQGGVTVLEDVDNLDLSINEPFEFGTETGIGTALALGLRLNKTIRVEAEVSYRDNDIERVVAIVPPTNAPVEGSYSSVGFLGNVYFDIPYDTLVKPYIGVGVGVARVNANDIISPGLTTRVDDGDTVIAYKIAGGIAYTISPRLDMFIDYHYFATTDPTFKTVATIEYDSEYKTHNVHLGLRYNF